MSRHNSRLIALFAALFLVLGLGACAAPDSGAPSNVTQVGGTKSKYDGLEFQTPHERPHFTLTDQTGQPYDFYAKTKGVPTVLYFGYTLCPDVCPLILGSLADALTKVTDKYSDIQVVFVTTDPANDTPPVLAAYLAHFDSQLPVKFVGLTGDLASVEAAQKAAGVEVAEDDGKTHSTLATFYGSGDVAHVAWLADTASDDIVHDIPLAAK